MVALTRKVFAGGFRGHTKASSFIIVYLISSKLVSWSQLQLCIQNIFGRCFEITQAGKKSELNSAISSVLRAASQKYPSEFDSLIAAACTDSENSELNTLIADVFVNADHHLAAISGTSLYLGLQNPSSAIRLEALKIFLSSISENETDFQPDVISLVELSILLLTDKDSRIAKNAWKEKHILLVTKCLREFNLSRCLRDCFEYWSESMNISPKNSCDVIVEILSVISESWFPQLISKESRNWLISSITKLAVNLSQIEPVSSTKICFENLNCALNIFLSKINIYFPRFKEQKSLQKSKHSAYENMLMVISSEIHRSLPHASEFIFDVVEEYLDMTIPLIFKHILLILTFMKDLSTKISAEQSKIVLGKVGIMLLLEILNRSGHQHRAYLNDMLLIMLRNLFEMSFSSYSLQPTKILSIQDVFGCLKRCETDDFVSTKVVEFLLSSPEDSLAAEVKSVVIGFSVFDPELMMLRVILAENKEHIGLENFVEFLRHTLLNTPLSDESLKTSLLAKARAMFALSMYLKLLSKTSDFNERNRSFIVVSFALMLTYASSEFLPLRMGAVEISKSLSNFRESLVNIQTTQHDIPLRTIGILAALIENSAHSISNDPSFLVKFIRNIFQGGVSSEGLEKGFSLTSLDASNFCSQLPLALACLAVDINLNFPELSRTCLDILTGVTLSSSCKDIVNRLLSTDLIQNVHVPFDIYERWICSLLAFLISDSKSTISASIDLTPQIVKIIAAESFGEENSQNIFLRLLKDKLICHLCDGLLSSFGATNRNIIYKEILLEVTRSSGKEVLKVALGKVPLNIEIFCEVLSSKIEIMKSTFTQMRESEDLIQSDRILNVIQDVTLLIEVLKQSFETASTGLSASGDLASLLFYLVHILNSPDFFASMSTEYLQSVVFDILKCLFSNIDSHPTKALIETPKASKKRKDSSSEGHVSSTYDMSRIATDLKQVILSLHRSTSSNTKLVALHLIEVLSPLAPDSVLSSINVLGELVSKMVVRSEKDLDQKKFEKLNTERDKTAVVLLKLFVSVIDSANLLQEKGFQSFIGNQFCIQAFLRHFSRISIPRRKSIVKVVLEALGEDSFLPTALVLFVHTVSLFNAESNPSSVDQMESQTILLSMNAQRKASRSMKISESEEIFQLIVSSILDRNPRTIISALVALLKCSMSLLSTISSGLENKVVSYKSLVHEDGQCQIDIPLCLEYLQEINIDNSQNSKNIGSDSRGNATSLIFVILEFIFEILENKAFHFTMSKKAIVSSESTNNFFQIGFLEFSDHCLQLLSEASDMSLKLTALDSFQVKLGSLSTNISASVIASNVSSWSLKLLQSVQRLLDIPTFIAILQELVDHESLSVRQKALQILGDRLNSIVSNKTIVFEHQCLFLELFGHLRSSIKQSSLAIFTKKAKSFVAAEINLMQSSIMCIDTLARSLGKQKEWHADLFECAKETIELSSTVFAASSKYESDHELTKLLGTLYLCGSTLCSSLGAKSLPVLATYIASLFQALDHYNTFVITDTVNKLMIKSRLLLIRSIISAFASIIFELPSFSHPYIKKILGTCLIVYATDSSDLCKSDVEALKDDSDRCMSIIVDRIPHRLLIPMLLKAIPELMAINHTAANRFCYLLSEFWETLTRDIILQFLPQLSSIAILALDYRRAFGDLSNEADIVDESAVSAVVILSLKFTEIELRGFLARLSEWRDIVNDADSGTGNSDYKLSSRSVVFFRLVAKLGEKLRSIFVPTCGIFWDDMKRILSEFSSTAASLKSSVSSKTKKNKKRKAEDMDNESLITRELSREKVREDLTKCSMVLECIKNCSVFDSLDFIDETRYESIVPEIMSLLPLSNAFDSEEDYLRFVEQSLGPCVTSLAICVGKDLLWKPMNHRVLMASRDERSVVRLAAIKLLHKLFFEVTIFTVYLFFIFILPHFILF